MSNIPEKEKSQCCFMETQQRDDTGNTIKDKRCYIIQDDYLNNKYNLNDFWIEYEYGNFDEEGLRKEPWKIFVSKTKQEMIKNEK